MLAVYHWKLEDLYSMVSLVLRRSDSEHSPGIKPSCPCILLALRDCRVLASFFLKKRILHIEPVLQKDIPHPAESWVSQHCLHNFKHPVEYFSHLWSYFILFFIYFLLQFFLNFYFYFILLYNTVLVLPYIDMNPPRVYMSSQSWTPLPPPTPYHLSGSSPCTSPKHQYSILTHIYGI